MLSFVPLKVVCDIPFDPSLMMMIAFRLVNFLDGKPMMPLGVIRRFPRTLTKDLMRSHPGGDKNTSKHYCSDTGKKLNRFLQALLSLWDHTCPYLRVANSSKLCSSAIKIIG